MPTSEPPDCSWSISVVTQPTPLSYTKLKLSPLPLVTPVPHLAGSAQVDTPFGVTVQPWLASRALAFAGSYGYGSPCLPLADRNEVAGVAAIGPTVGSPYPRSGPLMIAFWSIRYAIACRKYSCLKMAAWSETEELKFIA